MNSFLSDVEAIATWQRHDQGDDPNRQGGQTYVCTECRWRDRGGMLAAAHHKATGHAVRGRDWPAAWPDAQFGGDRG